MMTKIESLLVRAAATVLPFSAPALSACGGEMPVDEESVEATESPIVNGTVMTTSEVVTRGLAALYHRVYEPNGSWTWWPRPCTSTIVRSSGGVSQVLTARHCVTRDGFPDSTLLSGADIRILPAASPGLASPTPPAGAVTASSVVAMPVTSNYFASRDMAIVTVNANWSANVASRYGVLVANPSSLANRTVTAYGYGLSINDQNCYSNPSVTTGAGTARRGGPFTITSGQAFSDGASYYTYNNSNSAGQMVICGDSGGPDFTGQLGSGMAWEHLLGVHSNAPGVLDNTATGKWFQDALSGLYLSSFWDRNRDAGISFNGPATALWLYPTSFSGNISRVKYNHSTKQLISMANSRCLDSSAFLVPCTTSTAHQWNISMPGLRLVNVATGQCLTHIGTGGTLAMQTCWRRLDPLETAIRQAFAFHPQL